MAPAQMALAEARNLTKIENPRQALHRLFQATYFQRSL
jgi:hypothetical protein